MKRNSLLLILLVSLLFFSAVDAKGKWIKDQNGCRLWVENSANQVFKSVNWLGKCKNGYASGSGIARYTMKNWSQDIYRGDMKKGKIHGYGRYEWANKSTYAGEWKNGEIDGEGTAVSVNGQRYSGSWKNHKRHGKGKVTWKNPCPTCYQSFVGNFYKNTVRSGVYTLGNGKKINKKQTNKKQTNKKQTNKKQTELSYITSTYLDLMKGYAINRHLHYGN